MKGAGIGRANIIANRFSPVATEMGHCQVMYVQMQSGYVKRVCVCKGFSDEKRWKEGKRIYQ
jgi:hypothetical protein